MEGTDKNQRGIHSAKAIIECTGSVLTNTALTVLYRSGLPKSLWAEAFSTATYGMSTMERR